MLMKFNIRNAICFTQSISETKEFSKLLIEFVNKYKSKYEFFKDFKISMINSKISELQKLEILKNFQNNKINLL